MRGGHRRALRRLAIYPLVAILLIVVGNAAYAPTEPGVGASAPCSSRAAPRKPRPASHDDPGTLGLRPVEIGPGGDRQGERRPSRDQPPGTERTAAHESLNQRWAELWRGE